MDLEVYARQHYLYKEAVSRFGLGDVIRNARKKRGWNQETLGEEAEKFTIPGHRERRINKSTVSKVERDPYSSKLSTVWRLLAALDLSFAHIEHDIALPLEKKLSTVVQSEEKKGTTRGA